MGRKPAPAVRSEDSVFGMHDPIDDAYDAWKQADAAARVVQREVGEAWLRYDSGLGDPPSRDLLRELAWLRHIAGEKLAHAIGLLHDTGIIQPSASSAAGTKPDRPLRR
jgi:hypothetical protein